MCVIDWGNECRVVRRRRGQIQRRLQVIPVLRNGWVVYVQSRTRNGQEGENRDTALYALEMKVFRIIECHSMELTSTVGMLLSSRGEGHYA